MGRSRALPLRVLWLAVLMVSLACAAQHFEMKTLDRISDGSAKPFVIGGTKAQPSEWPATFVFQLPRQPPCTATAVGRRVILTAAHCLTNGAQGTLEVGAARIQVTCQHHPHYHGNSGVLTEVSADFALCHLGANMPGSVFEHVSVDGGMLAVDKEIHLLGFGCTKEFGVDRQFGALYEGDAWIRSLPRDANYYVTTTGDAAVCFGDSGGGAYHRAGNGKRFVVAINSRTDHQRESWLSATSVSGFESWARNWSSTRSAKICGIHSDAQGCRPQ